jgi:hypothetical protein
MHMHHEDEDDHAAHGALDFRPMVRCNRNNEDGHLPACSGGTIIMPDAPMLIRLFVVCLLPAARILIAKGSAGASDNSRSGEEGETLPLPNGFKQNMLTAMLTVQMLFTFDPL